MTDEEIAARDFLAALLTFAAVYAARRKRKPKKGAE